MSLEEGGDKPQGSLGNKISAEGAAWATAGTQANYCGVPAEKLVAVGAAVKGTGKGLVAVMLDRVYGK